MSEQQKLSLKGFMAFVDKKIADSPEKTLVAINNISWNTCAVGRYLVSQGFSTDYIADSRNNDIKQFIQTMRTTHSSERSTLWGALDHGCFHSYQALSSELHFVFDIPKIGERTKHTDEAAGD